MFQVVRLRVDKERNSKLDARRRLFTLLAKQMR